MRLCIVLAVLAASAFGQRHKLEQPDPGKPEAAALRVCDSYEDAARRMPCYEQFTTQYPSVPQTAWVLEQLQTYYVKSGQTDQILSSGDRLLALDPADPGAALECLKAAEAKKDTALIRKYSDTAFANAHKLADAPQPADASQVEAWKQDVDYARQVANYADYALFRAAVESTDPKITIAVGEALMARSPSSDYAAKVRGPLFLAYRQTGANEQAVALAEKTLPTDPNNEDMLLVVANSYLEQKKNPDKVHVYAARIVEVLNSKPKPEGITDDAWTAHKNLAIGVGHYINGKQYWNENKFAPTDAELRMALPLLDVNSPLRPETLFLLGMANYKLSSANTQKAQDAANYFRQCAAIKSPYQATAARNLKAVMSAYHGIK